jgi:hypothetical protein
MSLRVPTGANLEKIWNDAFNKHIYSLPLALANG